MSWLPATTFGLPLLERDLIEQSRRPKTYLVRTGYAIALCLIAFLQFDSVFAFDRDPMRVLGMGRGMFGWFLWLGMLSIYLVTPVLMCGAIAGERERNTLELLLITRLGRSTILFEKLFAGVLPMLSLLLVFFPLAGFFYSFGGLSALDVWCGVGMLFVSSIQVGSFSLMFSAASATTVSALLRTYVWGALLVFLFGLCIESLLMTQGDPSMIEGFIVLAFIDLLSAGFCLLFAYDSLGKVRVGEPREIPVAQPVFSAVARARPAPAWPALQGAVLPADKPVLWRQSRSRKWGLSLTAVELFLIWILLIGSVGGSIHYQTLSGMFMLAWGCAIPTIIVVAIGRLPAERSRRTLEILLTTPLRGRDIVGQHLAWVMRVVGWIAIPFATLVLYGFVFRNDPKLTVITRYSSSLQIDPLPFLFCWALSYAVYAPLVAWSSYLISLKAKSQVQALLGSLILWLAPSVLAVVLVPGVPEWWWFTPFLPAAILIATFDGQLGYGIILLNFSYYAALWLALRAYCLRHADRLLGRLGDVEEHTAGFWPRLGLGASGARTVRT